MRLPGRCAGCGRPVELAVGVMQIHHHHRTFGSSGCDVERKIPPYWSDSESDAAHVCSANRSSTMMGSQLSEPDAAITTPGSVNPDTSIGVDMKNHGTATTGRANRAQ